MEKNTKISSIDKNDDYVLVVFENGIKMTKRTDGFSDEWDFAEECIEQSWRDENEWDCEDFEDYEEAAENALLNFE
jgi:hypothetical protein